MHSPYIHKYISNNFTYIFKKCNDVYCKKCLKFSGIIIEKIVSTPFPKYLKKFTVVCEILFVIKFNEMFVF